MRGQDWALWSGALAASLLLHGLLFFNTGSLAGNSERPESERNVTRVTFRAATAPQPPAPTPLPVPEKPPEPEVREKPEPPPEPVTEPPPPKPEEPAEKARKRQTEPPREPQPPPQPNTAQSADAPAAPQAVKGAVADPALVEKAKDEYLRRLMAHIESHKHYPRVARRRGIQGDVSVTFTLGAAGTVSGLEVEGAQRVLVAAASDALEAAQPLPEPPETLPLPWEVSFAMRFTLR